MQLDSLRTLFETSATIRLLKSDHAAFIVDFLHDTFKSDGALSFGQSELRTRLAVFLETLHESVPEVLTGPVDRYLTAWSDAGWLNRFLQATSSEPYYQLTRHAEDAIQFADLLLSRRSGLVGTESRLRLVIDTLHDLVQGSSDDPARRLEQLHSKRAALDAEIQRLEEGGAVKAYHPAQIRERFQMAVELLKTLQGDFRAVEERFQEIARDVQREQQSNGRRGEILNNALDAEDLLKQQDEGISFYAFVAFLFSPDEQRSLRNTIDEVVKLEAVADKRDATRHLRRMVPSLLAEADKVMRTTGRLSATLRRLLDSESIEHRQRVAEELRRIRELAVKLQDDPPGDELGIGVDTTRGVSSPLSRTFWSPPQVFDDEEPAEHVVDLRKAQRAGLRLAQMKRLDFCAMRAAIRRLTAESPSITLPELIADRPIRSGVPELIGYLQIAHDDGHPIDRDVHDEIVLTDLASHVPLRVCLPRVTFTADRSRDNLPMATESDAPFLAPPKVPK